MKLLQSYSTININICIFPSHFHHACSLVELFINNSQYRTCMLTLNILSDNQYFFSSSDLCDISIIINTVSFLRSPSLYAPQSWMKFMRKSGMINCLLFHDMFSFQFSIEIAFYNWTYWKFSLISNFFIPSEREKRVESSTDDKSKLSLNENERLFHPHVTQIGKSSFFPNETFMTSLHSLSLLWIFVSFTLV